MGELKSEQETLNEKLVEYEEMARMRDRHMRQEVGPLTQQMNELQLYKSTLGLEEKKNIEMSEKLNQANMEAHQVTTSSLSFGRRLTHWRHRW